MTTVGWPLVALMNICSPKQWPTIPQAVFTNTGYPVFGANGQIGYYTEFNHAKPTVLITCRGATCGTINVCAERSYVTGNSMALDNLDESRVDLRFLVYALRNGGLSKAISGTAQPQITRQGLAAISIPLPPLPEQRRIADILGKADALLAKRRAALTQLDTLTQSIFLDMFGDPAKNPRNWPASHLRDLVTEFRYGTSMKSTSHGKPALRIPNVASGAMDLAELKLVPVDAGEFERLRLCDGDLLFVRTNGNPDFVGRCAVFDGNVAAVTSFAPDEFIFASYLIRARLIPHVVNPVFLREFCLGPEGRRQLRLRSKTSAGQFNINTESLGGIRVPVPPIELQREFARRVTQAERLKAVQSASLVQLQELFGTLRHHAFSGYVNAL